MENRPPWGIRFKTTVYIVIMITAAVSVMATYLIRTQITFLRNEFQKRAVALSENLARNCDYVLLLEDRSAIQNISLAMLQNQDVISVTVENIFGRILFDQSHVKNPDDRLPKQSATNPEAMHLETNGNLLYIKLPVWAPQAEQMIPGQSSTPNRQLLGYVTLTFSQEKTNTMVRNTIVTTTLLAIIVIGVSIILLSLMMNSIVTPLITIVKATRELSLGKLYHRVEIRRKDEIGALANAFNEMADSLEMNRRALEEYNQTLEEKIRLRTEALSDSEARYRAFFESTGTAIVITEEDGTIALVNGEFEKTFGTTREKVEGKRKWMDYVNEESLEKMKGYNVQRKVTEKSVPRHYEFRTKEINGHIKDIFITVSSIPGSARNINSLIDISDKKRLENGLQHSQKMEAIGTLAGGIAHDFNNLLMSIQGYATMMRFKMKKSDKYYEPLAKIEELVQSGANLTRQILGFAHGGNFEILSSNLNDIIEKTSTMFGRTKKEIQIKKRYQDDLWTVDVDRGQIEQVLLNIYVNAWHAMPGGGELYLETFNVHLTEDNSEVVDIPSGPYVKIAITDTGVGMDEKTKQRIFEPFFTTKEMGRGTGLGLATVYGIVKAHKGAISVFSEKGEGTSFHLYFPASDKDAYADEIIEKEAIGGSETILLVEDEETVLIVTKNMLADLGYHVICAGSGQEALDIYEKEHQAIDLVLLDMIMPGLSGGETFDRLQAIRPDVKAILCSGYSINEQANRIIEKGCRLFLQKPFSIYDIAEKIRKSLQ